MLDSRITELAKNLIGYSCRVKKGDKVLIEATDIDSELICELVREIYGRGGLPFVQLSDAKVQRRLLHGADKAYWETAAKYAKARMEEMDCYIGVRGGHNSYETSDAPADKTELYNKYYGHPVHHEIRVAKTRWVVLRYPNPSMAQLSHKPTEVFEDFYFNVCNLDYKKMGEAMTPLKKLMEKTDKVRITAPDTDLRFSVKGIKAIKCCGERNIPDGEIYTAPVRESVEGTIAYNVPSIHDGLKFENVRLEFKNGKIVKASSNLPERINKIFDADDGARYVGEFAIGVNPYITEAMGDILFDEKISGSIHFTPGACYDDADNGNKSALHWDLVLMQTKEHGGGEIYFDGKLIRKDGLFVPPELKCLNPENLK